MVIYSDCNAKFDPNSIYSGRLAYHKKTEEEDRVYFMGDSDYELQWTLNGGDVPWIGGIGKQLDESQLNRGINNLVLEVEENNATFATIDMIIQYGSTDLSDLRMHVQRNGKDYYYEHGKIIGDDSEEVGNLPLSDGERLTLKLEIKSENAEEWETLEEVGWQPDGASQSNTSTTFELTVNSSIDQISVSVPGFSDNFIAYLQHAVPAEEDHPEVANNVNTIDVSALPADIQQSRREMFSTAMTNIQSKNPALHTFITSPNVAVEVYVVPANHGNFSSLTSGISGTVNGVTKKGVLNTTDYNLLFVTNETFQRRDIIENADLMVRLSSEEKAYILNAINDQVRIDQYELLVSKFQSTDPSMAQNVNGYFEAGTITAGQLDELYYQVELSDVNRFIRLATEEKHVYLNEDALGGDQTKFTKTLAHEYKHIEFPINNKLEYLKWAVIRDTNNGKYDLKDGLGSNSHCSAGPGHERHNPENIAVCNEESRYN